MSKINIFLDTPVIRPGAPIKGKVVMELDKFTKASKLTVGIIVSKFDQTVSQPLTGFNISPRGLSFGSSKSTDAGTRSTRLYAFEIPLDGEKEYMSGEYPFELTVPSQISQYARSTVFKKPSGFLGVAVDALSALAKFTPGPMYMFSVEGRLHVPWGFDVVGAQDVTLESEQVGITN